MGAYIKIRNRDKLINNRIRLGYSIRKLARVAEVSPSLISRLETEIATRVSPDTAKRICDGIKCNFDDLFEVIKVEA